MSSNRDLAETTVRLCRYEGWRWFRATMSGPPLALALVSVGLAFGEFRHLICAKVWFPAAHRCALYRLMLLGLLSIVCGLILATVTRGRGKRS